MSTAHVESTVNQLINWLICKKQQMRLEQAGGTLVCYRSRLLRSMANCNRSSQLTPSPSLHDPQAFYGLYLSATRKRFPVFEVHGIYIERSSSGL